MDSTKPTSISLTLLAILMIVGLPLTAIVTRETFNSPDDKQVLSGEWAAAYESDFDTGLVIRDTAISVWSVIQYGLFREGREGVLVGDEGWLFTTEDFQYHPDGAQAIEAKLELISQVDAYLKARGIALVVAPIPDKSRLYADELGRYHRPSYVADRYRAFLGALNARDIAAPDLLAAMQAARADGMEVFLRTDTHWTPDGAELAARTIAPLARAAMSGIADKQFETAVDETVEHRGDLLKYIPLGIMSWMGPPPDTLDMRSTSAISSDALRLFDDEDIPLALVGTSYSANPNWNFGGALEQEIGASLVNVAEEGEGPVEPMIAYLEGTTFSESPPTVVIWDIPERFIPVSYDFDWSRFSETRDEN